MKDKYERQRKRMCKLLGERHVEREFLTQDFSQNKRAEKSRDAWAGGPRFVLGSRQESQDRM